MSFLSMKGAANVHMCTQLGINNEFMVDTDEACKKAGISKWSWTTDFVALNTPVQTVIHSAPG